MSSSLKSIDPSAARSIVIRPKRVPTRGLQTKSKLMHSTQLVVFQVPQLRCKFIHPLVLSS